MKTKSEKDTYKNLNKIGVPIHEEESGNCHYVLNEELNAKLSPDEIATFGEYFGIQTCPIVSHDGEDLCALYASDVEAVLARMFESRLIGSQLLWD